jgi:hypothetical protein
MPVAEATFTLDTGVSFTSATLRAVDVHAPGSQLMQDWTKAQTGDNPGGTGFITLGIFTVVRIYRHRRVSGRHLLVGLLLTATDAECEVAEATEAVKHPWGRDAEAV